jgi:hypothetical protein
MWTLNLVEDGRYNCRICGGRSANSPHSPLLKDEAESDSDDVGLAWTCWGCAASNPAALLPCCRRFVKDYIFDGEPAGH